MTLTFILEGFHIRAVYRMLCRHKPSQALEGVWKYPPLADVHEEAGLHTMKDYIEVQRDIILSYIAHQLMFEFCRGKGESAGPGLVIFCGAN